MNKDTRRPISDRRSSLWIVISWMAAVLIAGLASPASASLQWKMVWSWSVSGMPDAEVVHQAKSLGFNVLETQSPGILQECHRQGIKAAGLVCFVGAPPEYAQVVSKSEEEVIRREKASLPPRYQYGGEPVIKGEVMLEDGSWCFDRPETLEFGKRQIDSAIEAGYDVIAIDYVGYRNYHSCLCPVSLLKQDAYAKAHPRMRLQEATDRCSRDSLVAFYDSLVAYAKGKKPGVEVTAHLYPCFLPQILYGNMTSLDYAGQTVSWFFEPHWSLHKVARYSDQVVKQGNRYHPGSAGAPFIAIYTLKPYESARRTPERVREEIRIVKQSGANAIQFAELGNILHDPEIARVIREELN